MGKIHNFSAGPCILPEEVLQKAAQSVVELPESGLSLITMSHRSKEFVAIMERARSLVKEILGVPDTHEVVFLQGGASLGFYMSALNFMKAEGGKGAYINTGTWSAKAIGEAKLLGDVQVVASSEDENFTYIPKGYALPENADYLHFTSNNTIYGTQFREFPKTKYPLICDMSSDIFSREVNVADFALIYAGAQKNMGPAGTTVYIVEKELLGKTGRKLPSMLDLEKQIDKDSMYNTPPVFAVYVSMLTLEWLKGIGGIPEINKRNAAKAELLYHEIDNNALFTGNVRREDRSVMNATFSLRDDALKEKFDKMWNEARISGIKGHRSVGGYRASMYNALPLESVQALVDVMKELERKA